MVNRHRERDAESEPLMTDPQRTAASIDAVAQTDEHRRASVANVASGHPDAPLDTVETVLEVDDSSSGSPEPRFLQDERTSKQWSRVPYPIRRVLFAVVKWSRGPPNPQPFRIKPLFPAIQEYPLFLVDRFLPSFKLRAWVLFTYFSVWLIAFVLVKRQETTAAEIAGWGPAQSIGCGDTYWGSGNSCGLDGTDCRPFNGSGFAFSCPASCDGYHVLNPRAVGDQEIIYRSLVIGGPSNDVRPEESATYRGDSFICGAAIHAGVISDEKGGCGVVELVGQQQNFISSQRNGILSVGFDSYFPLSFRFIPGVECSVKDQRWALLAISVVFTTILSLFTASPALFFFPTFIGTFWTVGMAMDQPTHSSVAGLFSTVLGQFLPAVFCAWVMFDKMGIRRTLTRLTAQVEKTVLWLGACWVGALTNYTFDFIPIQRLNKHDIDQQPGAKVALAVIVVVLVAVVGSQVWFFRQEGRAIKYLKLYALFLIAIGISLGLPDLQLRIHHYILALLLLPGTSIQTRPSLLYQGLLVGLFVNGIARWGFDPVLQTAAALLGDGQKDTALPVLIPPMIDTAAGPGNASSITFTWAPPPSGGFDGISILVNDVERFRSYFTDEVDRQDAFVWMRDGDLDLPEYFRFAYMSGSSSGDYTKAGVWTAEGEWRTMDPGPSKVKMRSLDEGRMLNHHR
ncbi:Uncharacterized protein ESCO_000578 [Escovopsis weberi]|uniref:LCCL domain-containing protein n=1 Tax=Escovopsis weberi TaxID=150374 RepID=A0A0M8MW18_ESCWE|nr:Uncharacterized protein ESCO_000578 [Escovopsis weberi]